jgi:hypothetical protein
MNGRPRRAIISATGSILSPPTLISRIAISKFAVCAKADACSMLALQRRRRLFSVCGASCRRPPRNSYPDLVSLAKRRRRRGRRRFESGLLRFIDVPGFTNPAYHRRSAVQMSVQQATRMFRSNFTGSSRSSIAYFSRPPRNIPLRVGFSRGANSLVEGDNMDVL